jgi:hypothetical protein
VYLVRKRDGSKRVGVKGRATEAYHGGFGDKDATSNGEIQPEKKSDGKGTGLARKQPG